MSLSENVLSARSQLSLRSAASYLSGNALDGLSQPVANDIARASRVAYEQGIWSVSPAGVEFLAGLGITVSLSANTPHSHPIHKYIELDLLYRRIKPLLRGFNGFLQIKPAKVTAMNLPADSYVICNTVLTPRDAGRWSESIDIQALERCDTIFIHDCGHYMTEHSAAHIFRRYPKLQTLLVSSVYAYEASLGAPSRNQALYNLTYPEPGKVLYYLEAQTTAPYEQPSAIPVLLKTNRIDMGDGYLSLETNSVVNSHLTIIRRGNYIVPAHMAFYSPPYAPIPSLRDFDFSGPQLPVLFLKRMSLWAKAVRDISVPAIASKVRTDAPVTVSDQMSPAAFNKLCVFLIDYAALPLLIAGDPLIASLWDEMLSYLTYPVRVFFHARRARLLSYLERIAHILPDHVSIPMDTRFSFPGSTMDDFTERVTGGAAFGIFSRLLARFPKFSKLLDWAKTLCFGMIDLSIQLGRQVTDLYHHLLKPAPLTRARDAPQTCVPKAEVPTPEGDDVNPSEITIVTPTPPGSSVPLGDDVEECPTCGSIVCRCGTVEGGKANDKCINCQRFACACPLQGLADVPGTANKTPFSSPHPYEDMLSEQARAFLDTRNPVLNHYSIPAPKDDSAHVRDPKNNSGPDCLEPGYSGPKAENPSFDSTKLHPIPPTYTPDITDMEPGLTALDPACDPRPTKLACLIDALEMGCRRINYDTDVWSTLCNGLDITSAREIRETGCSMLGTTSIRTFSHFHPTLRIYCYPDISHAWPLGLQRTYGDPRNHLDIHLKYHTKSKHWECVDEAPAVHIPKAFLGRTPQQAQRVARLCGGDHSLHDELTSSFTSQVFQYARSALRSLRETSLRVMSTIRTGALRVTHSAIETFSPRLPQVTNFLEHNARFVLSSVRVFLALVKRTVCRPSCDGTAPMLWATFAFVFPVLTYVLSGRMISILARTALLFKLLRRTLRLRQLQFVLSMKLPSFLEALLSSRSFGTALSTSLSLSAIHASSPITSSMTMPNVSIYQKTLSASTWERVMITASILFASLLGSVVYSVSRVCDLFLVVYTTAEISTLLSLLFARRK